MDRIGCVYVIRKLNKITVFDPEPSRRLNNFFIKSSTTSFFSKVVLSKGYWQIKVLEEDIPKTAFETPDGHWKFLRMPFGMVNTKFTLQSSKCILGTNNVDLTRHRQSVRVEGLHEDNVRKISEASRPTTKKQAGSFIGLANYYRECVPNFAALTAPLTDLLKKGQPNTAKWEEPQELAFQTMRTVLTQRPILRLPDPNKTFILRTNASNDGIGAVSMQEHNGRPYQFVNARVMRWAMYLQNFNMRLEYIKGSQNVGADYMSLVV
ncbi:hypothetical protein RRG08_010723 [Elysia crispata]|uniref:Reverse transcriptase/retrotransposon-derived protein RNase H-like domain-containing protein n=1 Tax=Elysia crispata TaxID=231223 RepID=A0AAE1AGZ4_9GAST|nr:hypothetical protein RRG08_010723 [Elysia crispata]